MALPILPKAKFSFKSKFIPFKNGIEFTPFTVGQESLLLAVKDSTDSAEKINALRQIIRECVVTQEYDTNTMPLFLLELLFLKLREKSVGETIDITYICKNPVENKEDPTDQDKKCNTPMDVSIDLTSLELKEYEGHTTKFMITDEIGIKFGYPNVGNVTEEGNEAKVLVSCIEMITEGEKVHHAAEYTPEELLAFYNTFETKMKAEVYRKFLSTIPHVDFRKELTCPSCGKVHKLHFTSLSDFFT